MIPSAILLLREATYANLHRGLEKLAAVLEVVTSLMALPSSPATPDEGGPTWIDGLSHD